MSFETRFLVQKGKKLKQQELCKFTKVGEKWTTVLMQCTSLRNGFGTRCNYNRELDILF